MVDYIEREAFMKYPIRIDHYDKEHGNKHFVLGIESVIEYAKNLPAADVTEVRHGRWSMEKMIIYNALFAAMMHTPKEITGK